ncbi:hypothetical protein Hanom_Chr00s000789g01661151 [Helianthus anomalus]
MDLFPQDNANAEFCTTNEQSPFDPGRVLPTWSRFSPSESLQRILEKDYGITNIKKKRILDALTGESQAVKAEDQEEWVDGEWEFFNDKCLELGLDPDYCVEDVYDDECESAQFLSRLAKTGKHFDPVVAKPSKHNWVLAFCFCFFRLALGCSRKLLLFGTFSLLLFGRWVESFCSLVVLIKLGQLVWLILLSGCCSGSAVRLRLYLSVQILFRVLLWGYCTGFWSSGLVVQLSLRRFGLRLYFPGLMTSGFLRWVLSIEVVLSVVGVPGLFGPSLQLFSPFLAAVVVNWAAQFSWGVWAWRVHPRMGFYWYWNIRPTCGDLNRLRFGVVFIGIRLRCCCHWFLKAQNWVLSKPTEIIYFLATSIYGPNNLCRGFCLCCWTFLFWGWPIMSLARAVPLVQECADSIGGCRPSYMCGPISGPYSDSTATSIIWAYGLTDEAFGRHWPIRDTKFCGPPHMSVLLFIVKLGRCALLEWVLWFLIFWSPEHVSGDEEGGMPPLKV